MRCWTIERRFSLPSWGRPSKPLLALGFLQRRTLCRKVEDERGCQNPSLIDSQGCTLTCFSPVTWSRSQVGARLMPQLLEIANLHCHEKFVTIVCMAFINLQRLIIQRSYEPSRGYATSKRPVLSKASTFLEDTLVRHAGGH